MSLTALEYSQQKYKITDMRLKNANQTTQMLIFNTITQLPNKVGHPGKHPARILFSIICDYQSNLLSI